MTPQALATLVATREDTCHQFKRGFSPVSRLHNTLLAGHAFHILPYQGLGGWHSPCGKAWANINLQDTPAVNQFKAVVPRPFLSPINPEKPESQPESALPLETRVSRMLGGNG